VAYELPGVTQHSLAIEPTVVQRMQELVAGGQALTPARAAELMTELYRALVNDQSHRFAELFEHLLQADAPVIFHCTAGKDRTGVAAALILLALGVPRSVVRQDYLITNRVFRQPPAAQGGLSPEVLAVLWRVQPGLLDAALHAVDRDHGGVEPYLRDRLGLDAAARRRLLQLYLAPA
jgi:protein-tyrosine phosphatase